MKSKIIVGCLIAYFMSSVAYATGGWQQAQLWSAYSNGDDNLVSKIKQEIADKKLTFFLAKAKSDNSGM